MVHEKWLNRPKKKGELEKHVMAVVIDEVIDENVYY